MQTENKEGNKQHKKIGLWRVIISTFAAAFGVQSRKNHENDFEKGNVVTYIIAGVLFTLLFIIIIATLVNQIV